MLRTRSMAFNKHNETLEATEDSAGQNAGPIPAHAFLELLIILAKRKRFIISFVGAVAVISVVVTLLLTKYYTATTKILPPQQNQSMASALLGQLGPLAGLAGGNIGLRNPNDMYVSMLRSRTVEDALVDRFSLMGIYKSKTRVGARDALATNTEITSGRDNIISISVTDKEASRAADIANGYIAELDRLTRTLAVTDAGKKRLFFEREVKTANDELAKAEDALRQTQESTGIIQLDSQSRVMLQAYAELRALVSAKEVQVQAMRSFATADNPDLVRAQQELAALKVQVARFEQGQGGHSVALEKVPGAGLEYVRRLREVKYREVLLELLTKQYEIARIDEAEGSGLVQVLDPALPPEKRSWPPRAALVLASTLLAFIIAVAAAFLMEGFERVREDSRFSSQWLLLKFHLVGNSKGKVK
jgi:uncharacterized protein involved in exopolysaccharide biosynthesis